MLLDGPLLPVIVIVGMRQPVEIVGRDSSSELCVGGQLPEIEDGVMRERKCGRAEERVSIFGNQALECVLRELRRPVLIEPLLESATLVGPILVVIACRHV